jgi:uncharacterized protein involved in type VI secretion and phage assembly
MTGIVSTIQEIIRQELRRLYVVEMGVVEAILPHSDDDDNQNYACDVRLKNSGLLLKQVPVATGHIGTVAIPNVGDLVLLAFDRGDVQQPIIIGRLYNDEDRPPLNHADEIIFRLPLAKPDDETIKGAIRNIRSNSPPREVLLEMPPKITLQLNDGSIHALADDVQLKLDQPNASGGTVTVLAGGTKIIMNQDGDVTIEAKGSISIKANGNLSMEGTNVTIKGSANVSVEANAQATLKGAMTTVNGTGMTTVQGGVITVKGMVTFSP